MRFLRTGVLSLVAALLPACTATRLPPPVAGEASFAAAESQAAIALLNQFQRWQAMNDEGLERELAAANAAVAQQPADISRVRLAMLLSMPNGRVHNDARALALLRPVLAPDPSPVPDTAPPRPLRELALLLQTQIVERQRAVAEEVKRSDELAQKIEALRNLERDLIDREQKGRVK